MLYHKLGHTGIEVSPITIGAWQLGGPLSFDGQADGHPDPGRDQVIHMIRALGERGINAVDTAEQYGGGESERRVGEAVRGQRDRWIISTKFGYRVGPGQTREDDSSPGTILSSLEGSLQRLGTDYVDIYLYHCAPRMEDLEEGRAVLEQAREAGKIRCYGISTNDLDLVRAMQQQDMLQVLQFHANLLEDPVELRAFIRQHGIGAQVRGVMAQGRLSGKYFQHPPPARQDDHRSHRFQADDYTRFAALADCLPEGWTMAQAALRWALDNPGTHTVCLGAKCLRDYESALEVLSRSPLPSTHLAAIAARAAHLPVNPNCGR